MPTRRELKERERRAGFTLIETLAAVAVAASIIAATVGLIHHVALYFDRGVRGVNDAERFALATDRLARDFGAIRFVTEKKEGAASQRRDAPSGKDQAKDPRNDAKKPPAPVAFDGGAKKVIFVSASAIGALAATEEVLTLSVESLRDEMTQLVRRRAAWLGPRSGLYASQAEDEVVLLKGRYDISFSFARVDAKGALTWSNVWRGETELPRLIRLNLQDPATGASLIAGADFIVRTDAPPACAQARANCLPGKKGEASEKAEPPAREPT
jgi:prepilin-type N-terminal cleavage/methylation domain-containing protein